MNTTRELAEKVAQRITDYSFSVAVVATRDYAPHIDQTAMGNALYCYVVPLGRSSPPPDEDKNVMGSLSRTKKLRYFDVDVLVTQRTDTATLATVDPLVDLMDEIRELFEAAPLDGLAGRQVRCVAIEPVVVDPEDYQRGQFTSLLRLTFRVVS